MIQLVEFTLGRQVQSSIGFTACKVKELDLRSAALPERSIDEHENAEACLGNHDLPLSADYLRVAEWNVVEVKKAIKVVGKTKTTRFS